MFTDPPVVPTLTGRIPGNDSSSGPGRGRQSCDGNDCRNGGRGDDSIPEELERAAAYNV